MNFGSVKKMVRSAIPARVASMVRRRPKKFEAVVHRAAPNTWVAEKLPECVPKVQSLLPLFKKIEAQAEKTDSAGALPLWEGYHALEDYPKDVSSSAVRSSDQVRTARRTGEFYSWLVTSFKPVEVIEIGSAFGVSGMYWCAGLAANGRGNFTGFEPNADWAPFARSNIQSILDSARLVEGTFEDNLNKAPDQIDLAFIDAIHTPEFVRTQLNLVLERANSGALIVLDDIRFSVAMSKYWREIREDERFAASCEVNRRVGILELST